jgi:FAD/FMN-containing dehydrogenase
MSHVPGRLLDALRATLGTAGVITDAADLRAYCADWRNAHRGTTRAVLRPASTAEVATAVGLCADAGVALVPQGGNTGLCGGAVPDASGRQLVVSTNRMCRIHDVDPAGDTITVEAGVTLAQVQTAAAAAGRLFPLSLGAEGSCTIGGNLATNAGGTGVLRYGMMRDLTLGLEVVLPDGRVWDGLRALRKDNTGYDLKQLFVGSEGTLGIITAAVLRLVPATPRRRTAWVALPDLAAAVSLLGLLREYAGAYLSAYELMSRQALDMVLANVPETRDPLGAVHPWCGLIELAAPEGEDDVGTALETALGQALERDLVSDAVVAGSPAQRAGLWALREGISEAQNHEGPSLKHDVTVPIGLLPAFVDVTGRVLDKVFPGVRLVLYGHAGDGNLHYNLSKPSGCADAGFLERAAELSRAIYDEVAALDGSISAEHGLGIAKRDVAAEYKDPVELELMHMVKRALDPRGLMNPGKVVGTAKSGVETATSGLETAKSGPETAKSVDLDGLGGLGD